MIIGRKSTKNYAENLNILTLKILKHQTPKPLFPLKKHRLHRPSLE